MLPVTPLDVSSGIEGRRVIHHVSSAICAGVLALAVLGLAPRPLTAQLSLGLQASSAEKTDFGIGPRAVLDFGPFDAGLRVVGSFEIFFPGQTLLQHEADSFGVQIQGDADYWEANLNLLYTLGLLLVPLTPYLGGGLNIARTVVKNSTDGLLDRERTDKGVNLLAGLELGIGGLSPFVEFRYEVEGGEQWVLTGGVVF